MARSTNKSNLTWDTQEPEKGLESINSLTPIKCCSSLHLNSSMLDKACYSISLPHSKGLSSHSKYFIQKKFLKPMSSHLKASATLSTHRFCRLRQPVRLNCAFSSHQLKHQLLSSSVARQQASIFRVRKIQFSHRVPRCLPGFKKCTSFLKYIQRIQGQQIKHVWLGFHSRPERSLCISEAKAVGEMLQAALQHTSISNSTAGRTRALL